MSLFEDAMQIAVQLPMQEREKLARALGVSLAATPASTLSAANLSGGTSSGMKLPLHQFADPSKTNPVAWRKAETGHAVLDTSAPNAQIAPGAAAIAGIWSHLREAIADPAPSSLPLCSTLPRGAPVLLHTTVCTDLAVGAATARDFFATPPVEIRLSTATYLALLGAVENDDQLARVQAFVQPFAVLSLGPMASSRAVELMAAQGAQSRLSPLDALIAATALAHEIPIVTRDPGDFAGIADLQLLRPYDEP